MPTNIAMHFSVLVSRGKTVHLSAHLLLLATLLFSLQSVSYAQEPSYRDYDKHKAVSTCMEKIYLDRYQFEPADENAFPLCEQRFRELSQTLNHREFLKAKNQLPVTADGNTVSNPYYDTLFGQFRAEQSSPQSPQSN